MKLRGRAGSLLLALCSSLALRAHAHHGDEFLLLEDYGQPAFLSGNLSTSFDWEKYNGLDAFSTESMAFMTIAPRVALSISAGFSDEGDGWRYNAVTPRIHVQLTPPDWDFPIRVGVSVGYQFVDGAAGYGTVRVREVSYETQDCGCGSSKAAAPVQTTAAVAPVNNTPPCDPLVDVDCPQAVPPPAKSSPQARPSPQRPTPKHAGHGAAAPAPVAAPAAGGGGGGGSSGNKTKTVKKVTYRSVPEGESARSIHNHTDNAWVGRLIVEGGFGNTTVVFNLLGISPEGLPPSWGYAAGIRQQLTHDFGVGIEAIGDFNPDELHEMVGGIYFAPTHSLVVKLGAGFGLTEASPDFSLRTGLLWRF